MRYLTMKMALPLLVLLGAGCGNDDVVDNCKTDITSSSSPATGALTLTGSFYSNETVILRDGNNNQVGLGTPASDRSSFTLTGLPSGTHDWNVIISCSAGQDDIGEKTFVVQ